MSEPLKKEDRPSPEQQEVIDCWDVGLAVLAGAGSGKTSTLVKKCIALLKRDPEARFAAVSFTERSASDLREKLSEKIEDLSPHWVTTIHGLCGTILREYPREAGFDGEETLLSEPEAAVLWERALEALWFDELPEPVQAALAHLLGRESRDSLLGLLRRLRELRAQGALEFLDRQEDAPSQHLSILTQYVLERYDRQKRRRGALDFSDLELGADRALEHESVRLAFHRRFALVMVDEFQDTNPIQSRIILRFVRPDVSNLCVVGDPKQAIYRFRDAEVGVFEDFCEKLPRRIELSRNYRSVPGVLDFCNAVCAPVFAASQLEYVPLQPQREAAADALPPVGRLSVASPHQLADWLNAERARGQKLEDFALLLRTIRGSEKWLKALSAAGIPLAIGSGGLFWEDPRVRELVAFLRWWDQPGNTLSGAVFLRAPWVGIPDAELDIWNQLDPTWVEPFFASSHPLAGALRPLRGQILRPAQLLTALLVSPAQEDELGNALLGLWHRCEELSAKGFDFHEVGAELARAVEEKHREREIPPPKNLGQLQVLTIHGSKGMEFPQVILVDLPPKKKRASDAPLLFWDRKKGVFLGVRDDEGERLAKDPVELVWREEEKSKELAERKRLFYVALTRARESLILTCLGERKEPAPDAKPKKKATAPVSAYDSDDWRGWIEESGAPYTELTLPPPGPRVVQTSGVSATLWVPTPPAMAISAIDLAFPIAQRKSRHSVTEWSTLSRCSRAYEWKYIRPRAVAEGIAEIGHFTGNQVETFAETELSQRELGIQVHRSLELGDHDSLRRLEIEVGAHRFQAEPLISWALSSEGMAPAQPSRGRDVFSELEFEAPISGEVLVGSIDRLVSQRSADGVLYSIIDFKVTQKPKSVESLQEAYHQQMELYAWAVSRLEDEFAPAQIRIEGSLVNISARSIQTVPIALPHPFPARRPEPLAQAARKILGGEAGIPRAGPLCQVCEFWSQCPEAAPRRPTGA